MLEIKEASFEKHGEEAGEERSPKASSKSLTERKPSFQTVSLEEVNRLYTQADIARLDVDRDLSFPGHFPYTRGITLQAIGASSGQCASSRALARPNRQTPDSST